MRNGALTGLLLATSVCAQYTVSTIAGGSLPNNASAMSVSLTPRALAAGPNGALYIADQTTVYKLAASGTVSVTASSFGGIGGLAVDPAGNLYVSEINNNRVQQVNATTGAVRTFAGGGGSTAEGVQATKTQLGGASGIAIDGSGNLYIAESYGQRIRKVNAVTGAIETVAGTGTAGFFGDGGPALQAGFNGPSTLAADSAGNLYVFEAFDYRIRRIDAASKTITTVAGVGGPGFSGDGGSPTSAALGATVSAMAVDAAGNLYIADTDNHVIRKVAADLRVIATVAGAGSPGFSGDGGAANQAQLNGPAGLALDASGDLYIADTGNNRIREITIADNYIRTIAGGGAAGDGGPAVAAQLNRPSALAVDENDNLYVNDCGNVRVRRIALGTGTITAYAGTGYPGFGGDGGPAVEAALAGCGGLAAGNGSVYIADSGNYRVREVSAAGNIATLAGNGQSVFTAGVAAESAQFHPAGVSVDRAGNVFIADASANRVLEYVAAAGTVVVVGGNGSYAFDGDTGAAVAASLASPGSIAADLAGNLYIADTANHRIRRVDALSRAITTIAGTGSYAHSGDGGPARSADIAFPTSLAFDASGNLYFLESTLGNVRRIATSGVISTIASGLAVPGGLAIDSGGNFYVSEPPLNRVRKFAAPAGPLQIASNSPLAEAFVDVPYLAMLSASGGTGPYRNWVVLTGTLPPGLALDSNTGVLSGQATAAGSFEFVVQVSDLRGTRVNKIFKMAVAVPAFIVSAEGIVHGTSLSPGPVAPGEIVAIFGSRFGPSGLAAAQPDPSAGYPSTLGGVRVLFDNTPAPLLYVSSTQIGAVAPYAIANATSTTIQLEYSGTFSNTISMPVTPLRPGVFTADASGSGQALAVNEDGTVNSPANPARAGSIVILYATGFGVLSPAAADGSISSPPLGIPAPAKISVNGVPADVLYAGAAPGMISGVIQINVRIPAATAPGKQALTLSTGDISTSQALFIAVQ